MFEINLIGKSGFGAKGKRFALPCVVTYILNGVTNKDGSVTFSFTSGKVFMTVPKAQLKDFHRVRELTLTCDSVDQLK